MAGYTGLTERIGAERAYSLMEQVYEILIHEVYRYEGTVNELTGDGIMALFGAPVALELAPQRAVRSSLAIHREIARFTSGAADELGDLQDLRMRIGIHTGPVVVGTLGNDLRVEFKAVGDTVNLTARLEEMADPGSTLVSAETFKLTEGLFRFESLGKKRIRGKEQEVGVFRVIAAGSSRTQFDVAAERGLTPFLGRERELELLLDSFDRAREGRGQAVSVVAEAGLGKSRLLYELRSSLAGEEVAFLEGRCLSYCRGLTYYPLIDLLRSSFHLSEADSPDRVKARLGSALRRMGVDEGISLPWLLDLLAEGSVDASESTATPEARKARLTHALTRMLLAASEAQPMILVVEDLHWIDKGSEELLRHLLNSISAARILMLVSYRPEYLHTWGAKSYHCQLTLNRLSNRETLAMARHQVAGRELDETLADLVLEKTEGVPFFVEEFLRSLSDLGLLERTDGQCGLARGSEEISVPTTIQDVLMARVDLLPDDAKNLLRTASVVGREISHELLRRLAAVPEEELLASLSVLKDTELLYERGIYPHSTYLFKHALTREVVHDSLLGKRRRELHQKAGEAMEELFRIKLDEHFGVIAEHFEAGERYDKGAEYSRLAARKAFRSGAVPDAIHYARRRVQCIARLAETAATRREEIEARTSLASYLLFVSQLREARETVTPIESTAQELDDHSSWSAIFGAMGVYELFVNEDYAAAMPLLEKVLATSFGARAGVWQWYAMYYLGNFHSWNCRFDASEDIMGRALAASEAVGNREGMAIVHSTLAASHLNRGRVDLAAVESQAGLEVAAKSGDPTALALAHSMIGMVQSAQGLLAEARQHLAQGLRYLEGTAQTAWRAMILSVLADTLRELGKYAEAEARCRDALSVLEEGRLLPSWRNVLKLRIVHNQALAGQVDVSIDELHRWRRACRLRVFEGLTARLIAEILLATREDAIPEVGELLDEAVAADRANGTRWHLAQDFACLAELHRRRGDEAEMSECFSQARDIFHECGASGFAAEMERRMTASAPQPID
jgi:class 3 adenylate cyclase/tetratricopeptide (TPR) repeat protein